MARDLFGDVVRSSITLGSRKWYTLPLSMLVHTLAIAVVVVVPLMAVDVLPTPPAMLAFLTAAPPPPSPPAQPPPRSVPHPAPAVASDPSAAPTEAPSTIRPESGLEISPADVLAVEGAPTDRLEGGSISVAPEAPPAPPPVAPVPVGGKIQPPDRIRNVAPVYPAIAQQARVQGTVIIQAVIGPDGKVRDTQILRSIPLLDDAAVDAVRRWEYTPTLLNGVPVPVIMTVTVIFTLK